MARGDKASLLLFENTNRKGDNHPVKTGVGTINMGQIKQLYEACKTQDKSEIELECAAWLNTDKNGNDFFSITFEPKDPKWSKDGGGGGGSRGNSGGFNEDDIPF